MAPKASPPPGCAARASTGRPPCSPTQRRLPMTANRVRTLLATVSLTTVLAAGVPARAQMTVFDPSNYSQNVLTAARALQQINNQIQSLQNEAMSLINEARNLASLPYS